MKMNINHFLAAAGATGDNVFAANPGELTMMNAQISYNTPLAVRLSDYASGISNNSGIRELREFIAPTIKVAGRHVEYTEIDSAEKIKAVTKADAIRARGGEFRSLAIEGHRATATLLNYGFTSPVEYADMQEDENLDNEVVDMLADATDTAELLWAFDLLNGLAVETTIDLSETPDIDSVIKQAIQENFEDTGVSVNRVYFGGGAWAKRDGVYRTASLTPGTLNYARTTEQVGAELGVDVRVGEARVATTGGAMSVVRSNDIFAFFAVPGANRHDATNVKFFEAKGLNGRANEVFQSDHYQGAIRHTTLSRWGTAVVGNGLGVMKFTLQDS